MTATMWALYVGHRRAGLRAVLEVSVRASVLAERSAWILARELEEHETREDGGRGPLAWRLSEHFNMRPWREQRRRDLAVTFNVYLTDVQSRDDAGRWVCRGPSDQRGAL